MDTKSSGYSASEGCCGLCLMGPAGLLCGLCGSGSTTSVKSETWWACPSCGKEHISIKDAKKKLHMMSWNAECLTLIASFFVSLSTEAAKSNGEATGFDKFGTVLFWVLAVCTWIGAWWTATEETGLPLNAVVSKEDIWVTVTINVIVSLIVMVCGVPLIDQILQ